MTQAIVRSQSPEEREYERYKAEIEDRKRRAAALRADLEALRIGLAHFEAEYHARVGRQFVNLDQVRLAIDEYERRIARLQADPTADPSQIEAELRQDFAARHAEAEREAEETRRYEAAFAREQARPRLDSVAEDEIGRLYRDLARRYHPDLARTEAERELRAPLMQRINAAFRGRDLKALRALAQEAEADDPAFAARSIGEKLIWAIREVARLDQVIGDLDGKIAALRAAESYALWQRQQAGEEVLERLEAELLAEIVPDRERLATLIATYRQLLERQRV